MSKKFYSGKNVLITGGAGFIGSHLNDALIKLGAKTTIADDLSSGLLDNIIRVWRKNKLKHRKTKRGLSAQGGHKFIKVDLQNFGEVLKSVDGNDIVFHLAANIGGRGYITEHPADCCDGFSINQNVIKAASKCGVERILFASSACVYPVQLQTEYGSSYLLKEEDSYKKGWANADETYGWAKLMGEKILESYHKQYGLKGVSTRYVTVYGPFENNTHAIIALISRAVKKEDPFTIWGTGKQDRDFTYIEDIISGSLLACEKITDCYPINLGTGKRHTIKETVELIFEILGWHPKKIVFDKTKPEGVKTRALDISLAKSIGWQPRYDLKRGLEKTIEWFVQEKSVEI